MLSVRAELLVACANCTVLYVSMFQSFGITYSCLLYH